MKKNEGSKIKKKFLLVSVILGMIFSIVGCGSDKTNVNSEGILESGEPISIEDIDWFVNEEVVDGENSVVFGFTNNSKYVVTDVELEFEQKSGTTPEQLSVFSSYKEEHSMTDEEMSELYILGYNRKFADPGETVTYSPCVINGTFVLVENMSQYEIMEPSYMTLTYIGDDDKMHIAYYDYKTSELTNSDETLELFEWSETDFSSKLPRPDCEVVHLGSDDEEDFSFTAYGNTREMYESYIALCKEAGFNVDESSFDNSFRAYDVDGVEIIIRYIANEEKFTVDMTK